jgi:hypothetical protein
VSADNCHEERDRWCARIGPCNAKFSTSMKTAHADHLIVVLPIELVEDAFHLGN